MPRSIDIRLEPSLVELLITQCFTCKDFLIICNQSKLIQNFGSLVELEDFQLYIKQDFNVKFVCFDFVDGKMPQNYHSTFKIGLDVVDTV